jgi:SRSO17 transposase
VLALRLFLPESWTRERTRLERAGVPAEYRTARTKPELALVEIDRVIAAGVHFGCVLAGAGYGLSAPFRQALTARKLAWAVGIPRHLKVYSADVQMVWPVVKRGRPRQRHVPDAFLQYRRLKTARREKKNRRPTASANFASRAASHPRTYRPATKAALPALPKMDLQLAAA